MTALNTPHKVKNVPFQRFKTGVIFKIDIYSHFLLKLLNIWSFWEYLTFLFSPLNQTDQSRCNQRRPRGQAGKFPDCKYLTFQNGKIPWLHVSYLSKRENSLIGCISFFKAGKFPDCKYFIFQSGKIAWLQVFFSSKKKNPWLYMYCIFQSGKIPWLQVFHFLMRERW